MWADPPTAVAGLSEPTWLHCRLQVEDQLPGLHVEEAQSAIAEGGDHVGWVTADQVHWGRDAQLWQKKKDHHVHENGHLGRGELLTQEDSHFERGESK